MSEDKQKAIFSKNLDRYVAASGHTRKEISDILGFNYKTFNGWCNGISMPSMGKVQKIADYFHIGKSDLLDENKDGPNSESYYMNDDAREFAEFLYNNPEYRVLFDASRKVKKEDIDFVKQMIDRVSRDE